MNVKKCTVEPKPAPSIPAHCKERPPGVNICPEKKSKEPETPLPCLAICIEKIKNPELPQSKSVENCVNAEDLDNGKSAKKQ